MQLPAFVVRCLSWPRCCLVGLLLRLSLVAFGALQDEISAVPYTDIDYAVYSDAATMMYHGRSPYERATYRYTPLLGGLLIPVVWWPLFGKIAFIAVDIALAAIAREVMLQRGMSETRSTRWGALAILLNPLIMNLSTRGNADVLIVALVVAMISALIKGRTRTAAIVYGLAVHVKLYPIIYAPAIMLFLNRDYPTEKMADKDAAAAVRTADEHTTHTQPASFLHDVLHPFGTKLLFFAYSASSFLLLSVGCYSLYGFEFLFETYLYHATRVDTRHNFSANFYQLYLEYSAKSTSAVVDDASSSELTSSVARLLPFLSFLPQSLVLLVFAGRLYRDLPLCIFAQTLAFVALNKVVTAQYFLWWLVPLMLVAPQSRLTRAKTAALAAGWMATEVRRRRHGEGQRRQERTVIESPAHV